jgi:hypothetical protein
VGWGGATPLVHITDSLTLGTGDLLDKLDYGPDRESPQRLWRDEVLPTLRDSLIRIVECGIGFCMLLAAQVRRSFEKEVTGTRGGHRRRRTAPRNGTSTSASTHDALAKSCGGKSENLRCSPRRTTARTRRDAPGSPRATVFAVSPIFFYGAVLVVPRLVAAPSVTLFRC